MSTIFTWPDIRLSTPRNAFIWNNRNLEEANMKCDITVLLASTNNARNKINYKLTCNKCVNQWNFNQICKKSQRNFEKADLISDTSEK